MTDFSRVPWPEFNRVVAELSARISALEERGPDWMEFANLQSAVALMELKIEALETEIGLQVQIDALKKELEFFRGHMHDTERPERYGPVIVESGPPKPRRTWK